MSKLWLCVILIAFGCTQQPELPKGLAFGWQKINGRDEGTETHKVENRLAIYRAKVPVDWTRHDPDANESIADTMKAICEFNIDGLRITIHNFPSDSIDARIPPASQIHRWKQQFEALDPIDTTVLPIASGGFTGLFFEGKGSLQNASTTVIGWSLQMATEQYQNFNSKNAKERQQRSDFTIKAQGKPEIMAKYRQQLHLFASSFELIEEIPTR